MSDHTTVTQARSALARLYSTGKTPDREYEVAARQQLQTSKIDRAIRDAAQALTEHDIESLHPAQVEYLAGVLTSLLGRDQ